MTEKMTVTVPEAAIILGISRNMAYCLVRDGRLPAIRLGEKRIVVPKEAIEKIISGSLHTNARQCVEMES